MKNKVEWNQICELVRSRRKASINLLRKEFGFSFARARSAIKDLELHGIIGPAKPNGQGARDVLNLPELKSTGTENAGISRALPQAKTHQECGSHGTGPHGTGQSQPTRGNVVKENTDKNSALNCSDAPGTNILRAFFAELTLTAADENTLCNLGFSIESLKFLGVRSSSKQNHEILLRLVRQFPIPESLASGLYELEEIENGRCYTLKPNPMFCGAGRIRKLTENERKNGDSLENGQWVDREGFVIGWCNPFLIPYYNGFGMLSGLCPHNGMVDSSKLCGKADLYVPSKFYLAENRKFSTVIISGDELEAGMLWQRIGDPTLKIPSSCHESIGVCAVPTDNPEVLISTLEEWLRKVECRGVFPA